MVKQYLKDKGFEFTDIDVSDEKAFHEMLAKTGQLGVPVIEIDDKKIIIGFDKPALDKELEIK